MSVLVACVLCISECEWLKLTQACLMFDKGTAEPASSIPEWEGKNAVVDFSCTSVARKLCYLGKIRWQAKGLAIAICLKEYTYFLICRANKLNSITLHTTWLSVGVSLMDCSIHI